MSVVPPQHTCVNTADWTTPHWPCQACQLMRAWSVGTYTFTPTQRTSDEDIERIAKRVAELLKGQTSG